VGDGFLAPRRIVSLLPSATEICFALGLQDQVVGVSHECDFPAAARRLPVLTAPQIDPRASSADIDRAVRELVSRGLSIYRIDEARLGALQPDLIVTQDTCQVCAVSLDEVRAAACRLVGGAVNILSLSPQTLTDTLDDIVRVGDATDRQAEARALVTALRLRLGRLSQATASLPRPRILVLEWLAPPMIAGHWTPELIRIAGGDPILGHDGAPTSPIGWDRIAAARPEVVLVIPCGFTVAQTLRELDTLKQQPAFMDLPAARSRRIAIIDGNAFFNRPGPRLADSAEIAAAAIFPDLFARRFAHGPDTLRRW
jgi:iron complex transport system substrate-binding protein